MEDKKRKSGKKTELPHGMGAKTPSVCSSRSCTPSTAVTDNAFPAPKHSGGGRQRPPSSASTNSSSLDETDVRRAHERRFVGAPRRARSAERFDGIRVALANNAMGAGLERDELLARNFQAAGQSFGRPPSGFYLSRPSDSLASTPKAVPSPPPPYTPTPTIHAAHTTEMKGAPPSYTQAVQAALLAKEHAKKLNERYAMQHRHGHATQSFEAAAAYAGRGPGTATLRTATSVPTFKNYGSPSFGAAGAACGCSKCQVGERGGVAGGELGCDDAVYMESQAFLMHEIMTDGMAFCSIV